MTQYNTLLRLPKPNELIPNNFELINSFNSKSNSTSKSGTEKNNNNKAPTWREVCPGGKSEEDLVA